MAETKLLSPERVKIIEYRYSKFACCDGYMPGCRCREWAPWTRCKTSRLSVDKKLESLRRRYPKKYEFRITKVGG